MARWLVDGLNVIGSRPDGWWRDRPAAMGRLVDELEDFARASGDDVAVVFDGRDAALGSPREHVEVSFAPSADDAIAGRVAGSGGALAVTVVTSDRELARRVSAHGADVLGTGDFRRRLQRDG